MVSSIRYLLLHKGWVFDVMFNGTTQFSVNNTFLFRFDGHPISDGFWNIYWETPMGIKQCNLNIKDGVFNSSSSEEEVNWCISGHRRKWTLSTYDSVYRPKEWRVAGFSDISICNRCPIELISFIPVGI